MSRQAHLGSPVCCRCNLLRRLDGAPCPRCGHLYTSRIMRLVNRDPSTGRFAEASAVFPPYDPSLRPYDGR